MATACARLSEAKAGLTGKVTMRSASATSAFSRPVALAPEQHRGVLARGHVRRHGGGRLGRPDHRLRLVVGARGRRQHESAVGDRGLDRVVEPGVVENAVGAGGGAPRLQARPAVARVDEAQPRQPEIGHHARGGADVLAELRLDQHDDRAGDLRPVLGPVGSRAGHGILEHQDVVHVRPSSSSAAIGAR